MFFQAADSQLILVQESHVDTINTKAHYNGQSKKQPLLQVLTNK